MKIFLTGATGWVGNVVAGSLQQAGHKVSGLARSQEKAAELKAKGVDLIYGSLDDLDLLRDAAAEADAVIHTAFGHDFSRFAENAEQDRRAIVALGEALAGSGKKLVVTSSLVLLAPGSLATEADSPMISDSYPRRSETAAMEARKEGTRVSIIRLANSVHGRGERGFLPMLIDIAKEKGVSAYLGDGSNRWPAVHISDVGDLYRMVVEDESGQSNYHGVAEEGVPFRNIAEMIGAGLGLPAEPRDRDHFGWFAGFAEADMPASSARTRQTLGWKPSGPTLLEDLGRGHYFG